MNLINSANFHCPTLHYSLFGILLSPLVPLHRSSVAASSTATISTVAASATATTAIQSLLLSSATSAATSTASIVATTAGAIASTASAKKSRPTPLLLESISNHNIGTSRQSNNSSVCAATNTTTTTISHIKLLETMAVDETFGRLAKEFPNRLSNVHASIVALLKIVTAASAGSSSSPPRQQQQQPLPSSSCRRCDSLRSHLDSDDDDEVRDSLLPSRKRKVVGKDGLIRINSKCDSRRRRCHKQRMRNTTFDTIKMKKAIWAEFKDRRVSIDVSSS